MAKIKEIKKEEQDEIEDLSKSILESALKEFKEDHFNFTEAVQWEVSTGSLLLDVATGKVRPSLWRLCGNNNSGKTPQMLEIVRNILKDVPNSKALWVIAEGRGLSEENTERCGLKFVTDYDKWEVGTVFILKTNIFELVIRVIRDLVKQNTSDVRYAFVIDSIDGLILRDDAKKEITESNKVAGVPALSKKMLQSLSLGMFQFGHWMGLISQVTSEIKIDPYAKTTNRGGSFSGGNALLHGSDVIIEYSPPYAGDFILDSNSGKFNDGKTKPIGQNVTIVLGKSIKEKTRKVKITYPIKYGRKPSGIWIERELGDIILGWGFATKGGAWITFTEDFLQELKSKGFDIPEKVQGIDNLYNILEENKDLTNYLFNKFTTLIGSQ